MAKASRPPEPTTDPKQIDFTADSPGSSPVASDLLQRISNLAANRAAQVERIASLENQLKLAKNRLNQIEEVDLIEAMDLAGMSEFKTRDGTKISVKQIVAGSIPAKTAEAAFQWLRDHGHDGLIKREVTMAFGKGNNLDADLCVTLLRERFGEDPKDKTTVHAQTLGAWAREMLAEGETIPLDLLGIYVGRRATVLK